MRDGNPLRPRLSHALLSLLLSAGLTLPVLGVLLPSIPFTSLILPVLLTVLFFEFAAINRVCTAVAAVLAAAGCAVWLFLLGGLPVVADVARAVSLRFMGVDAAIPLIQAPAAVLLSVVLTFVSCLACMRGFSFLSALLCVSVVLLLYLTGSEHLIPYLIPGLVAFLVLLVTDRFPETSLPALLPWILLIVVAAFALAGQGTGETDLTRRADDLRQQILDRLFFTEPRDVFSLSSEGYYPEGQEQLGGPPNPRETPVMEVSAPRTAYLRGVVLNEYTGRSWKNTTGGRRYLWNSARFSAEQQSLFNLLLPAEAVQNTLCAPQEVRVRMLSDSASTLFVPQRIRELSPGGDMVPYFSNASEVFITRNLQSGNTYSVSAPLFLAGDSGLGTLIEVCSTFDDPAYDRAVDDFTSLPSHLEKPVFDLAREVADAGESPYNKALALQAWLSRSFRYTLDVDEQPADRDFVTRFLLETKEGYCTYFASAMTVLCRMVGLPARYVEGYLAEPDENGRAVVTGLNAHAWTEVYFKGFGWLTFDATPKTRSSGNDDGGSGNDGENTPTPEPPEPTPEPTPSPTPEPDVPGEDSTEPSPEPTPEPTPEPEPDPEPSPEPDPDSESSPEPSPDPSSAPDTPPEGGSSFPWWWLLLLLPILLLLLRIRMTSPSFRSRRAKDEDARLDVWAQEIFELLRAENLTRSRDESPMAFCRRVDRQACFGVSLGPVGECLSLFRYSEAKASPQDVSLVQDTAILLKGELSSGARLRYLLRRIFLPLSSRPWAA